MNTVCRLYVARVRHPRVGRKKYSVSHYYIAATSEEEARDKFANACACLLDDGCDVTYHAIGDECVARDSRTSLEWS